MFKRISISEVHQMMEQGAINIADIRDVNSFQMGHIEGAQHVTNDNLGNYIEQSDKSLPLVVVCYHGNSSQPAAQFLAGQGFDEVYSMDGGFEAWKLQYPSVS
nr:thiosulfate sulfurtransferase GlpE [Pleionea sp. CnH1-48]